MGAWGHGPFENDDAADWVWELEECDDLSVVRTVLEAVAHAGDNYLEAPTCSEALAAAEVVAALRGHAIDALPDEAVAWASGRAAPPAEIVALARRAVVAIETRSELRELWRETEFFARWLALVQDLMARLAK